MNLPEWISSTERILVAPLNWGLGHATRCIPIIQELISKGKTVFLASDGDALKMLNKEFPEITSFELPGYNVQYRYPSISTNILRHSIDILSAIKNEKRVATNIVRQHAIDTIIADNRYGVRSIGCKNVIICHQVNIKDKNRLVASLGSKINQYWINKFDECWIPDFPQPDSIAGELSLPKNINRHQHIGPLSRFMEMEVAKKRHLLVVLSGPEPKRTQLEEKLIPLLHNYDYLLIRGVIKDHHKDDDRIINYLNSSELNQEVCASDVVICRAGYSSIMDLDKLKKRAILIPTPGQNEQEYLAYWHAQQGNSLFRIVEEKDIETLSSAINFLKG